jgi:hypothetical protein
MEPIACSCPKSKTASPIPEARYKGPFGFQISTIQLCGFVFVGLSGGDHTLGLINAPF